MQFIWIGLVILSVWLLVLSVLFFSLYNHYNTLLKGSTKKTLQSLLEELLKNQDINKKDIDFLQKRCDTIEQEGKFHIQKIGLLRFNPFKDTGGEQSFILSLVDGDDTGIVISALYSRAGTRWYAKKVVKGKGMDYELSEEEKQAIKEAKIAK